MKTLKSSFGFSMVNAGQRMSGNVDPQLIAVSTNGGFRLTGAATRLLGIMSGDNVMFINNLSEIDSAIADTTHPMHADLVAFCEERGIVLGEPEAALEIHKEFDLWAVAKGIKEFDTKGNAKIAKERLSKKDKLTYATQHYEEMVQTVMESKEEGADAVRDQLTREGITREEELEILASLVTGREVESYTGSKCANPTGQTGSGLSVTFTDSNVWAQLKSDIAADDRDKLNRVYDLAVDDITVVEISNGYQVVEVKAIPLGAFVDKAPARVGKGADAETEEDEE